MLLMEVVGTNLCLWFGMVVRFDENN